MGCGASQLDTGAVDPTETGPFPSGNRQPKHTSDLPVDSPVKRPRERPSSGASARSSHSQRRQSGAGQDHDRSLDIDAKELRERKDSRTNGRHSHSEGEDAEEERNTGPVPVIDEPDMGTVAHSRPASAFDYSRGPVVEEYLVDDIRLPIKVMIHIKPETRGERQQGAPNGDAVANGLMGRIFAAAREMQAHDDDATKKAVAVEALALVKYYYAAEDFLAAEKVLRNIIPLVQNNPLALSQLREAVLYWNALDEFRRMRAKHRVNAQSLREWEIRKKSEERPPQNNSSEGDGEDDDTDVIFGGSLSKDMPAWDAAVGMNSIGTEESLYRAGRESDESAASTSDKPSLAAILKRTDEWIDAADCIVGYKEGLKDVFAAFTNGGSDKDKETAIGHALRVAKSLQTLGLDVEAVAVMRQFGNAVQTAQPKHSKASRRHSGHRQPGHTATPIVVED